MNDTTTESNSNQGPSSNWGGVRPGAGRPKGSKTKPRIGDFISAEKAEALILKAFEYSEGDKTNEAVTMIKFLLEQYFGKARQNLGIDGGEEGKPVLYAPAEILEKNNIQIDESNDIHDTNL